MRASNEYWGRLVHAVHQLWQCSHADLLLREYRYQISVLVIYRLAKLMVILMVLTWWTMLWLVELLVLCLWIQPTWLLCQWFVLSVCIGNDVIHEVRHVTRSIGRPVLDPAELFRGSMLTHQWISLTNWIGRFLFVCFFVWIVGIVGLHCVT